MDKVTMIRIRTAPPCAAEKAVIDCLNLSVKLGKQVILMYRDGMYCAVQGEEVSDYWADGWRIFTVCEDGIECHYGI